MGRVFIALLTVTAATLAFSAIQAEAQQPARYQPTRPTLSPYLQMLRRDTGVPGIGNYNNFYRPTVEGLQRQQMQNQRISRNESSITSQRFRVNDLGNSLQQIRQPNAAPTGKHATFMNYSHYFSNSPTNTAARR